MPINPARAKPTDMNQHTIKLKPVELGLSPSFGYGDRIGLATPGHVAAAKDFGAGIEAIFPQQSIREMTRTQRTAEGVMSDALEGMVVSGWTGRTGADADHLKTPADVDVTAEAGFTFFTIDPSDNVDEHADGYPSSVLEERFSKIKETIDWFGDYRGTSVKLDSGKTIEFSEEVLMRAAVKYGKAIVHAVELAAYIEKVQEAAGRPYEIELSVDETEQPTTLAEHWIIADQCLKHSMKLVSLAPRFIGEMEKGVDYIGDTEALERSLNDHAAVANQLGPYKLSLHSGSDKVSMYTALSRATKGRFHVKTAGTSYLEALRVAALEDPQLFREICTFSRGRYNIEKASYHVHATLDNVTDVSAIESEIELEKIYLERWADVEEGKGFTEAGRQILHCTFGSILTHKELGPCLRDCLTTHAATYKEVLKIHFAKHLQALTRGMP